MTFPLSRKAMWMSLVAAAAVAFVYWGVLARLGRFCWEHENYSHGLLIPLIIGHILWSGRARLMKGVRS